MKSSFGIGVKQFSLSNMEGCDLESSEDFIPGEEFVKYL